MIHNCICILILITFALTGCSGPDLERAQSREKITLKGRFLTERPDDLVFPVKVLFAIDSSLSMGDAEMGITAGSDPHYMRITATQNFINEYNTNDNTSFDIMLWSNSILEQTNPNFTKTPEELSRILDNPVVDTTTDYLGTLDAIISDIRADINQSTEEERIRSKYIVIFLSDGVPNTGAGGASQDSDDIRDKVTELNDMVTDAGVGSFNFHTFLLLGGFGNDASGLAMREFAEMVLREMAEEGNGQFNLFETAESIDFLSIVDMRITAEYMVKSLMAFNYNVKPEIELIAVDSDGDGLTDIEEAELGTLPDNWDTDNDGLSDYLEVTLSAPGNILNPLEMDSNCSPGAIGVDSDKDGLTDCDEYVLASNRLIPDSDLDGIPDGIEFLSGTNLHEPENTKDTDFDGFVDTLEVQRHTNVKSNDPKIRQRYSYTYDLVDNGLITIDQGTEQQSSVREFSFTISNIDIMNTYPSHEDSEIVWNEGDNLIRLFLAQVPTDRPDIDPVYRVAEVIVNSNDNNQVIELTPADFVMLDQL